MTVVAVTGATGFLGQTLLASALGQGVTIRALARRPQADLPGVTWIAGDLSDPVALATLCQGAQAVIHAAGLVNTPDLARFAAANVAGTANVIAAAKSAHTPRLVFVSSLSAREPGLSAYGASKAHAERLVEASPLDWTIVRPPTIYGPRDPELLELFRAARWGVIPVPAHGRSSIIHAEDLSALLLALIPASQDTTRHSFEPDDGRPGGWTHRELAKAIGQAVGRNPLVLPLSPRLMRWAAHADTGLRGAKAKLTRDRVGYMTHPDWVVARAAQVSPTLWQSHIPTPAGLEATARWYRQNDWL